MVGKSGKRGLFWESFLKSYVVKAIALLLVVSMTVVSCGREAGLSRVIGSVHYDTLPPGKALRPHTPGEKLHVSVTELEGLLAIQAKHDLTDAQAKRAAAARVDISTQIRALDQQFAADHTKLSKLHAKAGLDRLAKIAAKSAALEHSLTTALTAVPADGTRAAGPAVDASKALNALSPEQRPQPLSTALGFGMRKAEPGSPSLSAGVTPAYNAPVTGEQASSLPRTPEPEDLAATEETKVTPAIHALAQQLQGDPVKIYEYVRNNIRYEPYYGIRKGADETLAEKAGSDADQAALLIALLRDSGIDARFIQGVAELPAATAANWLGVDVAAGDHLDSVPQILASGGVPTTQFRANGQLTKVRFNHIWAEAYVPSDAYRGADEGLSGKTWLPLDPSIKQNDFVEPVADFQALMKPALQDWATAFMDGSQKIGDYGIVAPPIADTVASTNALVTQAQSVLSDHGIKDGSTLGQVFGGSQIRTVNEPYLPASTPFVTRGVVGELRTLPSSLNASVSVAVSGSDPLSQPSADPEGADNAGFTFTAPTVDLANKRITIAYVPATENDSEIIDAYHGLLNAPAYAASLIPVLRVDGQVVARGHQPVSTGYTQDFKITYRMPGFAADTVDNPLYVGSLSAIALALGHTPSAELTARAQQLAQFTDTTADNVLTDARAGETLSLEGSYYFARNDHNDEILAQGDGIDRERLLSGAIVASSTGVSYLGDFPVSTRFTGFNIDVDEDAQSVVSKRGDDQAQTDYLRAAGIHASSSESTVFEQTMRRGAVSTAEIMRDAMARGAAVLKIDKSNVAALDNLTQVSADVRQQITRAVNEDGATVFVPDSGTTLGGWTGTGYVIDEGSSIDYRISGGANGGSVPMTLADAADMFDNFVKWILPCFMATDDYHTGLEFALAALAVWRIDSFIDVGGVLAVVLAEWAPIVVLLLLTVAIYYMIQATTENQDCAGENQDG